MNQRAPRADAVRNRGAILAATERTFRESANGRTVSVDQIAAAAGVGKGTIFRHFTDRAGLLAAVVDAKSADLRASVESASSPLGPEADPRERALGLLSEIARFKLEHRRLVEAMEDTPSQAPSGVFSSDQYRWVHGLLAATVTELGRPSPAYTAHALLSLVRADLLLHLSAEGATNEELLARTREAASGMLP